MRRAASITPDRLRAGAGGNSPFAVAVAALALAVRRRTESHDVTAPVELGAVVSNRIDPETHRLAGYFLNTLPMTIDIDPGWSCSELVAGTGREIASVLAHRSVPIATIVADRRRHDRPAPSLDVLVSYHEVRAVEAGGARGEPEVLFNGFAVADATVFVEVRADRIDLGVESRGSRLGAADADALLDEFDRLLTAMVDRTEGRVGALFEELPTSRLEGEPLAEVPRPLPTVLADATPARTGPAVRCGDERWDWPQLGARAGQLAAALAAAGVGPGQRVVVELPRGGDLVASIVAIWRLGASYVPVDPEAPADRRRLVYQAAGARHALSTGSATDDDPILVRLDPLGITEHASPPDPVRVDADDEAYVLFTSGSTGTPRGVPIRHGQLARSTAARLEVYGAEPVRYLMVSKASFDSSVAGIGWMLLTGGELILPTDDAATDPRRLAALIEATEPTHTLMVPTLYRAVLARKQGPAWPTTVIVAGEACPADLVEAHHSSCPGRELVNEYGPTEATVWATVHRCAPGGADVPIGRPIPGVWTDVVDHDGRSRPPGIPGELVIGGPTVAAGYLGDAARTAERFRGSADGSVFLTGDRAVVDGGTLRFLGRVDHQLNVAGVRAEPEEIEAVIASAPGVEEAVVVGRDVRPIDQILASLPPDAAGAAMERAARDSDPARRLAAELLTADSGRQRLVAHLVPRSGAVIDPDALRDHLVVHLPGAMHPTVFCVQASLPRTLHGKLDRAAALTLPLTPLVDQRDTATSPEPGPTDAADRPRLDAIRTAFCDVLGVDTVDETSSFFALGGDSLAAIELLERIEQATGTRVSIGAMYSTPTPRGLAAAVGAPRSSARLVSAADARDDAARTDGFLVEFTPAHPTSTRAPMFGVHVLGRNGALYRPLAARLGPDQPLYGLGLAGTLAQATVSTEIHQLAAAYADEVEHRAPYGPVHLAAVSMGAVAALETAAELRRRGRTIGALVLFDALGPDGYRYLPHGRDRLVLHARELRRAPATYVARRLDKRRQVLARRWEMFERTARVRLHLELPDRLKVRGFIEANVQAAVEHRPTPHDGPLTIVRAADESFVGSAAEHGMGWEDFASRVEVITVPGGHLSMLAEPFVGATAAAVAATIDRGPLDEAGAPADSTRPVPAAANLPEPPPIAADLLAALDAGRFEAALVELIERVDQLGPEDADFVRRADRVTRGFASASRDDSVIVADALTRRGFPAVPDSAPDRRMHVLAGVSLDGSGASARTVLDELGYAPLLGGRDGWSEFDRVAGAVTCSRLDDPTRRLVVRWSGSTDVEPGPDATATSIPDRTRFVDQLRRRVMPGRRHETGLGADLGPFLATPWEMIIEVIGLARPAPDETVIDLGCGDGRVLIDAARRTGIRGVGYERDAELVERARAAVAAAGLRERIQVVHGDALAADLSPAGVVFVFLPVDVVTEHLAALLERLPPGARLVAHEQAPVTWPVPPDERRLVVAGGITVASVWRRPRG
ncbi:MAG: amino acid adenylation domain-containing protein [Ilumatobacteraceae bacterium]